MITKIAIVGRVNTGKTTLIRTITKGAHGKVEDRAGVTTSLDPVDYTSLHAKLIDTPGFQEANTILHLLNGDVSQERILDLSDSDFPHEKLALLALSDADAVLYLASVEVTPDKSHGRRSLSST